jgi:hypothetical protein
LSCCQGKSWRPETSNQSSKACEKEGSVIACRLSNSLFRYNKRALHEVNARIKMAKISLNVVEKLVNSQLLASFSA